MFANISGPLILPADSVRLIRNDIRSKYYNVHKDGGVLSYNVRKKTTTLVESPRLFVDCTNTAIITPSGKLLEQSITEKNSRTDSLGAPNANTRTSSSTASGRTLSNRYTWYVNSFILSNLCWGDH